MEEWQMLLIDFCSIKQWDLRAISELMEKYQIQRDGQGELKDIIINCKTRHDNQHNYILVENNRAKTLQQRIPQRFIIPSQPEFQNLWKYLIKSQSSYKAFLNQCMKGYLDLIFLNNLLLGIRRDQYSFDTSGKRKLDFGYNIGGLKHSKPCFFPTDLYKAKNKKKSLLEWNPVLRLMDHGDCIEDAIDLEIINIFLAQRGEEFSKVKRCHYLKCNAYFIAARPRSKFCKSRGDQCRYDYNNMMKKEAGYSKEYYLKFEKKRRVKGIYQNSAKRKGSNS
jgi:hypothetical protein